MKKLVVILVFVAMGLSLFVFGCNEQKSPSPLPASAKVIEETKKAEDTRKAEELKAEELRKAEVRKQETAQGWYFRMTSGSCVKCSEFPPSDRALDDVEGSLAFLAGLANHHISSPADLIETCRKWEIPYSVQDTEEDGRPVAVTVSILRNALVPSFNLTFRRLENCRETVRQDKAKLDQYK